MSVRADPIHCAFHHGQDSASHMDSIMPLDQTRPPEAPPMRQNVFRSTKTYGHAEGLSCAFRQWRASHSHCRLVHGYALAFKFVFVTGVLDERNWCFDFGGLKKVKSWLHEMFDHTLLVASDDPELDEFRRLDERGVIALRVIPAVGCEAVAHLVFDHVAKFVAEATEKRVRLEHVEVSEHSGNSASYSEDYPTAALDGLNHRLVPAQTVTAL